MSNHFESYHVEPNQVTNPDMLGIYAMPIAANAQNTGDRIQAMANQVGVAFEMVDYLMQNKKTIFDMAAKDANTVQGNVYQDMSRHRADHVRELAQERGATTTIGIGDSLGVPVVQGIQLHGGSLENPVFNGLLLRDGWNLSRSASKVYGVQRYLGYQVVDAIHQKKDHVQFDIPETGWKDSAEEPSETNFAQKMLNVADLMRGPENRQNAIDLAGRCATGAFAMRVVGFRNGVSGSEKQFKQFASDLTRNFNHVVYPEGARVAHMFRTTLVDGYHSDLLDPQRGARDVQTLIDAVER